MKRTQEIRARIINAAGRESAIGSKMRIPGMKIGTQIAPAGPKLEDISWLCDKVEEAAEFMKKAEYHNEHDMHMAMKLVHDIEGGI